MGRILTLLFLALTVTFCCAASLAEISSQETEQGLDEIETLMEIAGTEQTEGMSLEEITEAMAESVMSEYYDSATGFRMQYPSAFQFDESSQGSFACTEDHRATLFVDNLINQGQLNEEMLLEAIRLEIPNATLQKNEKNGCLRVDRSKESETMIQTDLYLLTEKSFHHITLSFPAEEKEVYFAYVDYMINTMETEGTDVG